MFCAGAIRNSIGQSYPDPWMQGNSGYAFAFTHVPASADLREETRKDGVGLIDRPGKDSYPITGAVYAVCLDRQPEGSRKQIVGFLRWATHEGQADVVKANFAPLPPALVERVNRRLDTIKAVP
jgi:hypothetical protein